MIIKFLSRKSNSGQLLKYICRYILDEEKLQKRDLVQNGIGEKQEKFLIRHNVRARTIKGFLREFNENESYRLVHRKDSVKLFHTIISFSPKDRELLNDKILKDIARKFIEERGVNSLYVGSKHENKDHLHLHLCSSGTQLNGRSARLSNQKFRSIKLALDRYQREQYPFLTNSLPEHGKSQRLDKEKLVSALKANRQLNKAELLKLLEKTYLESKSKTEFISKIKEQGHEVYTRSEKLQGILFEGKTKYRFSRLGFDQERFEALDRVDRKSNDLLLQIRDLRNGRQRDRKPEINLPQVDLNRVATNKNDLEHVGELAAIRSKAKENEKEKDSDYERARDLNEDVLFLGEANHACDDAPLFFPGPIPRSLPLPTVKI